jgi:L-2,4-diaminobutyrate decarboxylase
MSESNNNFEQFFLCDKTKDDFKANVEKIVSLIIENTTEHAHKDTSLDIKVINSLEKRLTPENFDLFPKVAISVPEVLKEIQNFFLKNYIHVTDKKTMAHLHCPPTLPCVVTELIIAATNQSMDSWDQCGTAGTIEENILLFLGNELIGYPAGNSGTFTTGATQANLMGLLIGRNVYALKHGVDLQKSGITPTIAKFKIFCSEDAHFTIDQSAAILGLGSDSIIKIESECGRIRCDLLRSKIKEVRAAGDIPFCISATAGTTDFGAIDDLSELAKIAEEEKLWYHVDAAYGGGLLFTSDSEKRKLIAGIEHADSIGLDFHKMLYVPIPCGVFMTKNKKNFETIRTSAVYLNPENDEIMGFQNLVYKSLLTTRRFDALKAYVALRVIGRDNYSKMIAHTTGLAKKVAAVVSTDKDLQLALQPTISTVVFRFCPADLADKHDTKFWNDINYWIRNKMIERGGGVIAQTTYDHRTQLKFTMLNPMITLDDVNGVLSTIKKIGYELLSEKTQKK